MSTLRASAVRGVLWTVFQTWAIRLSTVAAFIVISRQLQPSEFGLVALSIAIVSVLQLVAEAGMGTYLVRKDELQDGDASTVFWTGITLTAALSVALAAASPLLAQAFDEPDLTPLLVVLSCGLLSTGLSSVPTALLKRELRFKTLAIRGTAATITGTVAAVILALAGAGAWALVIQFLIRSVLGTIILWWATTWRPALAWNRQEARSVFAFGAKVLGLDLMLQARDRGEDFVLAAISTTASLGLWSVASRLVRIIQETGSSVVSTVATPTFAKLQHDMHRMYRAYSTSQAVSGAIMFPALFFLAATSPQLIPLVLGQQWSSTGTVAQIVALSTSLGVITYFDRTVFLAVNRLRPEMVLVFIIVGTHLATVFIFAPKGLTVLAVALLVRAAITVPVRSIVLHRVTGMPYRVYLPVLRVAAAAGLMTACTAPFLTSADLSPGTQLLLAAAVAVVTYPAALWLLARSVVRELIADARSIRAVKTPPTTAARRATGELTDA